MFLGISPLNGKSWSEAAKYRFMELAQGKDLVALVVDNEEKSGFTQFKLVDTSEDCEDNYVNEELIIDGYAILKNA